MTQTPLLDIATEMVNRFNHRDERMLDLLTDDIREANYQGTVMRDGKAQVQSSLRLTWSNTPHIRLEIVHGWQLGKHVVLYERVLVSPTHAPMDVVSIFSFEGERIRSIDFVR